TSGSAGYLELKYGGIYSEIGSVIATFDAGGSIYKNSTGTQETSVSRSGLSVSSSGTVTQYYPSEIRLVNSNSLDIRTNSGTGMFGARNASCFHMDTDRSNFYMYKPLNMAGGSRVRGAFTATGNVSTNLDMEARTFTATGQGTFYGVQLKAGNYEHIIAGHTSTDRLVIYPQRFVGQDIFEVRSHHNRGTYRAELAINTD